MNKQTPYVMKMYQTFAAIVLLFCAHISFAQETENKAPPKKDNTGTNPADFSYDTRFYWEHASLDLDGTDGSLSTSTFEFRLPLGRDLANMLGSEQEDRLFQIGTQFGARMRFRYKDLNVENPGSGPFDNSNVSGIGDIDARILWLAHFNKTFWIVPGLEVTFDTATHDALGFGKTVLAPMIFFPFPGLLGKGSLFVPGYQYLFDVGGDSNRTDVSRSQIDLYFVWLLAQGKHWFIVNPQMIIDHESSTTSSLVEAEWGTMITPLPGASVYIRPGWGLGDDKPYSWNIEFGFKFVWR